AEERPDSDRAADGDVVAKTLHLERAVEHGHAVLQMSNQVVAARPALEADLSGLIRLAAPRVRPGHDLLELEAKLHGVRLVYFHAHDRRPGGGGWGTDRPQRAGAFARHGAGR